MFLVQVTPKYMFPVIVGFTDEHTANHFARDVEALLGDRVEVKLIKPLTVESDGDFAAALSAVRAYASVKNLDL